ncbi:hypothetical protein [uncultured Sphingomonas sp.]|uniref:hypothetical protein n=1 Tax=uncultured Sphingomonas sp. TaxID=158754 RepID=UPI0025CC5CE9|nr:hypothetical protein [uncultured Sphingomonas sp.]
MGLLILLPCVAFVVMAVAAIIASANSRPRRRAREGDGGYIGDGGGWFDFSSADGSSHCGGDGGSDGGCGGDGGGGGD